MSQKIYKLWRIKRWTEAWLQLPKEEQDKIFDQVVKSLESVGGKSTIRCTSYWANEACLAWGVNVYPDLEAAFTDGDNLRKMDWGRYLETETILGISIDE
jgi:hypothetical protein